ncbi:hypothetical protein M514_08688 [Trichuris suis]|uniref:BED-type domain-containing protein n=1 Tax=Trichuris suis TaxID=68888 RepID=A0A085LZR5_9BILA|nr:hypothetical protein M513_08688 [Trichuris suis]KFD62348.1 hypothetical protein M514_08688 [Trichuris suis]
MCLLCNRVFSNESMKPSRLKEHLAKIHPDKAGKDFNYFKSLPEKFRKRPTLSNVFYTNGLDESSLPGNKAILLAYVRHIKEGDLAQEFLLAREFMDSKGKSIFQVVEGYFKEKEIALTNVISVATDRAPSMVGCQRGFISYLKKVVPNVLAIRFGVEEEDASLCANLKKFEGDIAYMADLYMKFNEMNLQLQDDDLNLIKTKSVISARKGRINEQNVEVYWRRLELLHQDFIERLEDILSLEVPDWITGPFSGVENAELQLQEELLELQANEELKPKFNLGYRAFWLQRVIPHLYPGLWNVVRKLLISFPSSYLAERGFSVVADLLTKKRNKLQIVNRGDLRLRLTSTEPDVENLLSLRGFQA